MYVYVTPCISQLTKTHTKQAILNMFKINSVSMQTWQGGTDYGVFDIAVETSLGYDDNPAKIDDNPAKITFQ